VPWGLFLVALRLGGGEPFDYQPMISFTIALVCSGAMFVSMGLFFSSLTRGQIISAVLTFVGMFALTAIFFVVRAIQRSAGDSAWVTFLTHLSYFHLWTAGATGRLDLKLLLFPLSATVIWLFLTVQVLNARKWS
jgi:ABC-2 type transport system permease protein